MVEFYNAKTLLPYLERIKMLELSKVYTRCLQILKKESKLGSLLKIHVTNTEILYDVLDTVTTKTDSNIFVLQ